MSNRNDFISFLRECHGFVKAHSNKFTYKYDSTLDTFQKARDRVLKGQTVGMTCLVPIGWALQALGIKRADGKSWVSGKNGSFKQYYTGGFKDHFIRITSGGAIGKTAQQAVDAGLLRFGDIIAFKDLTHTFVYSGEGYIMFEGGSANVKNGHQTGIRPDYSAHYKKYKISEILRWKEAEKLTKEQDFIALIAPLAQADAKTSGILASITIAQAILESGYGTSDLARKAMALFGIKKNGWSGKTYTKKSYEYVKGKKVLQSSVFRAYGSWQESVNDHSNYLKTRKADGKNLTYKKVVGETDYKKAAKALQSAGYSTYPTYAQQLIDLIEKYKLTQYDVKTAVVAKGTTAVTTTTKTVSATTAKKKSRIFLDAGHGGKDPGAVLGNRKEKTDVLKLVLAIGKKLTAAGYTVGYARTTDIYESPTKKAQDSNDFKADYFFSFHRNCYNKTAHGYETLYYSHSTTKDAIMKDIETAMIKAGFESRGTKHRTDLTVLKKTSAPALLFEIGFIDNAADNKIFDNKYDEIVQAFVNVITEHCK